MTRPTIFFSTILLIACIPGGFAGPACSKKHFKAGDCVQRCKAKWGWSGKAMGTDPWGPVMQKSNESPDAILSKACGFQSQIPPKPVGDAQDAPKISTTTPIVTSTPSATNTLAAFAPPVLPASTVKPSTSIAAPSSTSVFVSSSTVIPITSITSTRPRVTRTSSSQQQQETPKVAPAPSTTRPPVQTTPNFRPAPATTKAPEPAPAPSPPSTGGSTVSSGSTSNSDIQAYLAGHNTVRARHGAADLTWNDNLAAKAQQWANGCQFKHSGGSLGAFGENLAAGTGSSYGISTAIKSWTDEVGEYNPNNPKASHFTQVVWKASTQVGCAVQSCDGIFDASFGKAKYFVCEYSPAGNVNGRFAENVQV